RLQFAGTPEGVEEFVVPRQGFQVEKHRPRCVRRIGHVHIARRELPDEPRVDRPESKVVMWLLGSLENPLEFRCREIRVRYEARTATNEIGRKLPTTLDRSAVLPDDRGVHGAAALLVPDERRLALGREPDRRDTRRAEHHRSARRLAT